MNASCQTDRRVSIGIDVGGCRKGFHGVALRERNYSERYATTDLEDLVAWCHVQKAAVIAVDAPCEWNQDNRARPAERELMAKKIWCFSTPSRQRAYERESHFGWMLQGRALFRELKKTHRICEDLAEREGNVCFETFPHAITWHLRGGNAKASQKRAQRRQLLKRADIDITDLTNIDFVDAALCALVAHHFSKGGSCTSYGKKGTGLIIVPQVRSISDAVENLWI